MAIDPVEDEEWKKAESKYHDFDRRVTDILQKERPADLRSLENPTFNVLADIPNIQIQYFPFSVWMFRFDDQMKRSLSVNINSYRFQKNLHEQQVLSALSKIASRKSGMALLDEIRRIGKKLRILPFWKFGKTPYKNDNPFFPSLGINATTRPIGTRDRDGHSDVGIQFTSSMWGPATFDPKTNLSTGTSGYSGPSTGADETLFHEMVHGTRNMIRGVDKTQVTAGYQDKEEYVAVVVTNIYLAEKAPDRRNPKLRANEESFDELPDVRGFIKNTQHINIPPRQLMRELFNSPQRPFFVALGNIPQRIAWWNPARTVGRELGFVR